MTNVDELQRLIAQLEDGAQRGASVQVSARDADLLLDALDARMLAVGPSGRSAGKRFRIVALQDESGDEALLAYAATIEMATVLFDVAVRQQPAQTIRLYNGDGLIKESGGADGGG
jgi:hypothetical protein